MSAPSEEVAVERWEEPVPPPRRGRAVLGLLVAVLAVGFLLRLDGAGGGPGTIDVVEVAPEQPVDGGRSALDPETPVSSEPVEPTGGVAVDPEGEKPTAAPTEEPTAAVDVAVSGEWTIWRDGPVGRWGGATAWTGEQLVVVGGAEDGRIRQTFHSDVHVYDRPAGAWRVLDGAPLAARTGAGAVSTGEEVIVWGGVGAASHFADGVALEPRSGRWRAMAPSPLSPRADPALHWTGAEVLVVGGHDHAGPLTDAAAYDPAADRWRPIADPPEGVWWEQRLAGDGSAVVRWSPERSLTVYDIAADSWADLRPPTPGAQLVGATSVDGVVHTAELLHRGGTAVDLAVHRFVDGAWEAVGERLSIHAHAHGRLIADGDRFVQTFTEGGYAAAILDTTTGAWQAVRRDAGVTQGWESEAAWDGTHLVVWGADNRGGAFASSWSAVDP